MEALTKKEILNHNYVTFYIVDIKSSLVVRVTKRDLKEAFRNCKKDVFSCDVLTTDSTGRKFYSIAIIL
jgi:hypothetical protein